MMAKKWTLLEQGKFLKKTGELLERGYSYSEAVESILFHMPLYRHSELKSALQGLKAGEPFHLVLEKLHFQKDLIGYIYFADKHGGMLEAISEGSKLTLKKYNDVQRLKKTLFYPAFLFFMTNLLLIFVERTLLPQYFNLYDTMGIEMNIFTEVMILLSDILPIIATGFLLVTLITCFWYLYYFRKLPAINQRNFLLRLPIIGSILRLLQTQYFTLQLGYLLSGGLSLYEALKLFEDTPRNRFYQEIGKEIKEMLRRGEDFSQILIDLSLFERELPIIFKHGQSNGRLERELLFFSQTCLRNLEDKLERSLKVMQPLIYGVIALIVVSMYLSIMLPLFQILNEI